jgi:hypothetical protein
MQPEERFWARIVKSDRCWMWTGATDKFGYGQVRIRGTKHYVHRWSYEQRNGAIPAGLVIDHLCRVTSCVRPDHMEVVSPSENSRRAVHPLKVHCPRGHEYVRRPWGPVCGPCRREHERRRYALKKQRVA